MIFQELCSVLIAQPAFGLGSDIRRGPGGRVPSGGSPAQALERGWTDPGSVLVPIRCLRMPRSPQSLKIPAPDQRDQDQSDPIQPLKNDLDFVIPFY